MREKEVREAIRAHNLSVEEQLRIRLAPGGGGIVCSKGGRRLQRHEHYLHIVAAAGCCRAPRSGPCVKTKESVNLADSVFF